MTGPGSTTRPRRRLVTLLVGALALSYSVLGPAPAAQAAQPTLSHVDSASTVGNRINHSVDVPGGVQAGDTLVLFLTANSLSGTLGDPAGWDQLESGDTASSRGRAWTRQATAGDAGTTVTVPGTARIKSTLTLAAYRSSAATSQVTASALDSGASGTTFTTPDIDVEEPGSWLISSWSEKSSGATTWTAPTETTTRETLTGTGGGKISTLLGDSDGPVPTGTATGLEATTDSNGARAHLFSVVITPGPDTDPGTTNQPPVASFTVDCTDLTCEVDATDSTDPDDDPLSYAWNFGDGTTDTGVTATRTYTSAGARTITLTVDDGTTTTATTRTADPTTPGGGGTTAATLSHVDSASTVGNRINHSVDVPGGVQAGDTLVLFLTANSLSGTLGDPAGWDQLESGDTASSRGRAWTRQATAGDAGTTVTVPGTARIKSTLTLAAYRSSAATSQVTASALDSGASGTTFTTPDIDVEEPGSWLISSWSEKSSGATTWTAPTETTTRETLTGTGGGKISTLLGDSDGPVPTGTATGLEATTDSNGARAHLFSVVITPGPDTDPGTTNQPPVASFTVDCTDLTCEVDATDSTDPDDDPLSYAWNFGDGTTDTGVTATRTYTSAGARTITLTVDDGTTTTATTRTADPTTPGGGGTTAATLSHVDSASTVGNRINHSVDVPGGVQAGDTLVLFLTANSLSGTLGDPAGWDQLESGDTASSRGRAWTRQATAGDAGTTVTVPGTARIKSTLTLAAYRSSAATSQVTASALDSGASGTTFTTPDIDVEEPGSWLISSWSEKSSGATTWTAPTETTTRETLTGTGGGKISTLLGDSDGPVPTGTATGLEATTDSNGARAHLFSVVITPGPDTGTDPGGPPDPGTIPAPGHTGLVPQTARTDMPRISDGEILDLAVIGNRVFVAGSFTSIQNQRPGNTTTYQQAGLASYNLDTGLVDADFRPDFGDREVLSVAVTPDGTKLYASGTFNSVNGTTRRGLAQLDLDTGAPLAGFVADASARVTEVVASNTTVYAGGRFTSINGTARRSLAALDATTGAVHPGFVNDITQGAGVNGAVGVQRLVLAPDMGKLVVVHTGMQVDGQPRAGVAIIDTTTEALLPWHTTLWEDNLQYVGGIQRAYGAAISPDGSYFVVVSGSGGDRPPINDTAMAFPMDGGEGVEATWISRCFDSIYSVAISETAVYVGGHFAWNESPTANDPWPGQADIGYGTGQGLSAYSLGDQVVVREHLGALDPATGTALEWDPGSDSYEGNKAMVLTPRGLITGGDAVRQGGANIGRLAFFDFDELPAPNGVQTAITEPIMGRVLNSGSEFTVMGTASAPAGVDQVDVVVQTRSGGQYLQDDLTTWNGTPNTIAVTPDTPGASVSTWELPVTVAGNVKMAATATTVSTTGATDPSPATKRFETFNVDDRTPTARITGPGSGTVETQTFTVTGTTADDNGVVSLRLTIRNEENRYLQEDGTVASPYHAFRITPDVPGAPDTTWSKEITVPVEGTWRGQVRAVDTAGQSSLDTTNRTWIVSQTAQAPVVSVTSPGTSTPPTAPQPFTVVPGEPITFTGSATDDGTISSIDIALLNMSTQEYLTVDGTFGRNNALNLYRLERNLDEQTVDWSYTTPYDLTPGSYRFLVLATDDEGLRTPSSMWANSYFTAQVEGDSPPKATLSLTGTQPPLESLDLDLAGSASDDVGVSAVRVALRDDDTGRYATEDGGTQVAYTTVPAVLDAPGATSTGWTLPFTLPTEGEWEVTAVAFDDVGQYDFSSAGATARYLAYPGDEPPTFNMGLLAPTEGTVFSDGKVFVSGRAEDDESMAEVEVQILNPSTLQYMTSSGGFRSTPTWINAFLTSPGTPGSNFSYASPIIPAGDYTVLVRGTDQHGLVTTTPPSRSVTVEHPDNEAPVAVQLAPDCTRNVCQFDARTSTDETPSTLSYTWDFGDGTGTTGPFPKKTYTRPSPDGTPYTVTLTATDQWGEVSAPVTTTVTMPVPADNAPPEPVINQPSCAGLSCNFSAVGSSDPDAGDEVTYTWEFGDPASGIDNARTGRATSHVFTAGGQTYTVRLTATDGWGAATTVTREVALP